jgi:NADPH:quinone reductase-like Zn-dependent oxidoreductase
VERRPADEDADEDADVDVVGRVEALGPGVAPDWLGRRVVMLEGSDMERVVVPIDGLVPLD